MQGTEELVAEFLRNDDDAIAWITESICEGTKNKKHAAAVKEIEERTIKIINAVEEINKTELGEIFYNAIILYIGEIAEERANELRPEE